MFRRSSKEPQLDAFATTASLLEGKAGNLYKDKTHWHNQFYEQITKPVDEATFKVLFNETMGAPNAPVRILCGMMILKESMGWSDSQLFEQCNFNLLVRKSLGLININDSLPVESTYYLFRKRIYEYQKQSGEDLMEKVFADITGQQVKEFEVNGRSIRMDSKLIGSNIALFTRYEIIHQTLCKFYKSLDNQAKMRLSSQDIEQLEQLIGEEPSKTVYRSTREEIKGRLQPIGLLVYKLLQLYINFSTESYLLLERIFKEQYKVQEDQHIELRPKEEISSSSLQSPHDPDSAYRNKDGHQVKGYSVNITETCSDKGLNLITSVIVEKANTPDTAFVEPAIQATEQVTGQEVEKVYADGAYQSPDNDSFCEDIDMVYTGIQGAESRYDLEMTQDGLLVTDTQTGEQTKAVLAKKLKNSKEDKWRIPTTNGYYYFSQQAIRASELRRQLKGRSREELNKRNNVEASIFQLAYLLRNNKSKYRGIVKQKIWAVCRCLWVNLVRILNYMKQTCQRTPILPSVSGLFCSLSCYLGFSLHLQSIFRKKSFTTKIFYNIFDILAFL